MALRRFLFVLLVVSLGGLAAAEFAYGAAWVAPVPDCAIVTAYGQPYPGGTHRGVDLRAEPGALVSAPAAGRVTFAGNVPADGGGTCGAVTVEFAGGLRVSLLPLAEVFVTAGETLAAGEVVGSLAAQGDESWSEAHLHLGLRRGDTYLDPTGMLPVDDGSPAPIAPPIDVGTATDEDPVSGPPEPQSATVPGAEPVSCVAPAAAPTTAGVSLPADARSGAPVSPAPAPGGLPVAHDVPSRATGPDRVTTSGVGSVTVQATREVRARAAADHAALKDAGIAPESTLRSEARRGRAGSRGLPVISSAVGTQALWMVPVACAVFAVRSVRWVRAGRVCAK